jgi:hypothetical protein
MIRSLVGSEELILQLTPRLSTLTKDVLNLQRPGESTPELFQQGVDASTVRGGADKTWEELFRQLTYFEHAGFAIVQGEFTLPAWDEFRTDVAFAGLARGTSGKWIDVQAQLELTWRRTSAVTDDAGTSWTIVHFTTRDMKLLQADQLLFADQLDQRVRDNDLRQSLRESEHYKYAVRHYYPKRQARLPDKLSDARFFAISTAEHPGVSVVDIDGDGWDDLYVMERWGKNILLRNRGDGTFENVAGRYGLDLPGRSNAAVFADFDNDGDPDLMLARSFERSRYLVNDQGRFVDRSDDLIGFPLPFEATSVSAADYNGDGLLDVYFCTYHQDDISRRLDADLANPEHRIHKTLTPEHSAELTQRFRAETRSFISQIGPPNIMLVNVGGGRFELAPENPQIAGWRNSFQAGWADYDQDGDADLYVANDFAPDHLFRNDGPSGFHDVSTDLGIDRLGFAMGVGWGDENNDGQLDAYISNMFSKAGQRITKQVDQLDPRFAQLADGNYLYRFDGRRFQLASGYHAPQLMVAKAGWSWGGQFFDANNDGYLDLYVPNGYYTVPAEFETTVDL